MIYFSGKAGTKMNNFFAENLLKLRKNNKMTQEQLATRLGVSFQSVSKWENNQGYPDIELWPEIASVFKTSIDALMGYNPQKVQTTHYEQKYCDKEYYWGNQIWDGCYDVLKIKPLITTQRLLDVGCGEGQAALFFAKNGYKVSAFDISHNGVEKGRQLADENDVQIDFFEADILNYKLENNYDIVFSSGALQYIPKESRKSVVENWKRYTNTDGIHILNVFVEKPFLDIPPDWEDTEYFWKSGELFEYYHDWKLEKLEEIIFDCDSGKIPHQHCMDIIIARKVEKGKGYR